MQHDPVGSRVGKKHFRMLALKYIVYSDLPAELKNRRPKYRWGWYLCRCDCGVEKYVAAVNLMATKSCGCLNAETARRNGKLLIHKIKDRGMYLASRVANFYRQNARARGLEWNLDNQQVAQLISQPCYYCGDTESNTLKNPNLRGKPEEFAYNGIDRIDPAVGYSIENVVPCCKKCNTAKLDMLLDEFVSWVERVHTHMKPSTDAAKDAGIPDAA